MNYVLETHQLSKHYHQFRAVDQVDMHVKEGAIYGFIGKNGAGKTTLMKMVCGLNRPTSGSIKLFDSDDLDTGRKKIGSIIENPALIPNFTVKKNIQYYTMLRGATKDRMNYLLELVGLDKSVAQKKAENLSLGMKQRLSIAIALLHDPRFLVLDEPINGLDPEGIIEVRNLLILLNREMGITILISSHILGELEKLVTCYGIIKNGKLVREFDSSELENMSGKNLTLTVSDPEKAYRILKERYNWLEMNPLGSSSFNIKNPEMNPAEVNRLLVMQGIDVSTLYEKHMDIEEYFIELMGGMNE